jgi:type I restriction enzyme S subunit
MFNTVKLKSISKTIGSGITPLRSNPRFWENGIVYWLKTEQLGEHQIYETTEKISQFAINETSIKIFPKNTLSIAMYGEGRTRGNVSILKTEMTTNQACCNIVIDDKKADYEYVYYFLKTQYQNLRSLSSGVRKNLNSNDIKEFEIRLPKDLQTQEKIAKVLSDLDAKIEINNRINSELDAMAKMLYDYWFVQFDFPDANGKPYKTSGGKMVWNAELKREIPEGWGVLDLEKVESNIVTGKTPLTSNPDFYNGNIPFITIGDVRGNMHIVSTVQKLTLEGANQQINKFIPKGAICATCIASPGLVGFATEDSQTNQQLNSVVCKNFENRYYLYFYLTDYFKYSSAKTGNTFANMNKGDFSAIKVIKPKKEILFNFSNVLKSSIDKILNKSLENQELDSLRDWLLPMLMNGQVSVGDVVEELRMVAEERAEYKKEK